MDDDDRFDANHQDVIRRRKRLLNENKEQRQQRLHHETELYHIRQERKLEALCDQKAVKYTPPQNSNESIQTKKKRRKIIRKQFATDHVKDPLSNASKKDNDHQYSCDHKVRELYVIAINPQPKQHLQLWEVMGKALHHLQHLAQYIAIVRIWDQ